jgi:serine/threonine protein kinase
MSIPCIVEGVDKKTKQPRKYMAKVINDRSALMHRYMTILRNLGVMAEGATLAFDGHEGAQDMIEFERNSLMLLKNRKVNVPEVFGAHRLNHDDYVLVMQFVEGLPLSKVELTDEVIGQIFSTLKTMHDTGVFHGDIKLDNFLYSTGRLYVVDCLKIDRKELWRAQDFDLMCAICALAQRVPVDRIFKQAELYHTPEELRRAGRLLGVAMNKVDLDIPEENLRELKVRLTDGQTVTAE